MKDLNFDYFDVAEAFLSYLAVARAEGMTAEFLAEFFQNLSITKEECVQACYHACIEWDIQ